MALKLSIDQVIVEAVEFAHRPDHMAVVPSSVSPELSIGYQANIEIHEAPAAAMVRLAVFSQSAGDVPLKYTFNLKLLVVLLFPEDAPKTELERRQVTASGIATLMPFARELLASLTGRGRFGTVFLPPVNVQMTMESLDALPEEMSITRNQSE